ncbi:MAG: hypothetical protein WD316_12870 [Phycisphaeraceae bacterium]
MPSTYSADRLGIVRAHRQQVGAQQQPRLQGFEVWQAPGYGAPAIPASFKPPLP